MHPNTGAWWRRSSAWAAAWRDAVVRIAASYEGGAPRVHEQPFDVAIFDYMLGSRDGLSLLREIRTKGTKRRSSCSPAAGPRRSRRGDEGRRPTISAKAQFHRRNAGAAIRHALALPRRGASAWARGAALRASEERFRALVENTSDALVLNRRRRPASPIQVRHPSATWAGRPEQMVGPVDSSTHRLPDNRRPAGHAHGRRARPAGRTFVAQLRFHHATFVAIMRSAA